MSDDVVKVPTLHEPVVPLSVLALDLADAPASGWTVWLAERGIAVAFDDIGRPSIARADAKRLLDAQRQDEIRRQDLAARLEQEAVEADRARRAQLPKGLAWFEVPHGLTPAEAMVAGDPDRDKRPKRTSVLEESLSGGGMVFHSLHQPAEDESS
jgi:hypothetical protein